jgi:hypothetical protein
MNDALQQFVSETEAQFQGRLKTPRQLIQREVSRDEFVDTAVVAGYSLADILDGRAAESDIDPQVIHAFHLQYSHAGEFVHFVQSHAGDDIALAGIVNGIKGKLFEVEYVDWLNHGHLPDGATAELASNPTQAGSDIAIKNAHGYIIDHLQLKATESLSYIKEALAAHPDIDVVGTHEIFQHLNNSGLQDHVIAADVSDEQLTGHVHAQVHAVDMTPQFHLPLLAFGIAALQSYKRYKKGKLTAAGAISVAVKRAWRSLLCRGASHASIVMSHEPLVVCPSVCYRGWL